MNTQLILNLAVSNDVVAYVLSNERGQTVEQGICTSLKHVEDTLQAKYGPLDYDLYQDQRLRNASNKHLSIFIQQAHKNRS